MSETPLSKIRMHWRQLKDDRRTWEPYWFDAQRYIDPDRGRGLNGDVSTTEASNGTLNDKYRINGTASFALTTLASGMQSGLTSKARQWFVLTNPNPELENDLVVRDWYDKVQSVLESIFRRSNIYSALLHTYTEMALFGQGAIAIFHHPENVIFARTFTAGEYYMSTDERDEVDTFFYVKTLTARQLVLEYGEDKLPDRVKQAYRNRKMEDRFKTVNAILKHPEMYGLQPPKEGHSVVSVHFLENANDEDGFLRVDSFREFPVMTPRWEAISDDVYGKAPCRKVIGDVKALQKMEKDVLQGCAKGVNPPVSVPPELERRGVNTSPGAVNVVSMGNAVVPLYQVAQNVQQLEVKIQGMEQRIKDGLFNSLFLALLSQDNPQMTAREVAERHEEKLLMLGPVLERIHYELLDPLIDRVFSMAFHDGLIPPPPPQLAGQETAIEYVSILSQAQKAVGVSRIEQGVGFMSGIASIYPEVRHAFNPFKVVENYTRMIGVKSDCLVSEEEYNKAVAQEKQQQQMAAGAEVGKTMAQGAQALGMDKADVMPLLTGGLGGLALG